MKKRSPFVVIARFFAGCGLFLFASLLLLASASWFRATPPSDEVLLAHFKRHEASFTQLIGMIHVDKKLERVDDTWTAPENPQTIGVSKARIEKYRKLCETAGIPRGFQTGANQEEVQFYAWVFGSGFSSDTMKGYAYLENPPAKFWESLDGCHASCHGQSTVYRLIGGHWYLFYKYLPG